ncbi:MAG: DUF4375 domain-containing protein [Planctomycetota bacterium]
MVHTPNKLNPLSAAEHATAADALSQIAAATSAALGVVLDLERRVSAMMPRGEYSPERLPQPYRDFCCTAAFDSQIPNGGFPQAICNSTGDYLPFLADAYRRFGADSQAYAIDKLNTLIPETAKATDDDRTEWMSDMSCDEASRFYEYSDTFTADGYDHARLCRLRYAVDNPSDFFLSE